ncbi:Hypothetical protein, putative [Bodo saltans]|uniref:Uncharacterized protein n=1 Tax=Bodo saltans TaxID=75058 RepID=A0A0S4IUH8_BODSA|nr:Hypothetical protein, putative [Bodo saltans]|eukprot:CUG10988.1 Hypothetical protein, putative [Bodo saltans]
MCRVYGVTNLASGDALKGMSFEYVCDNVTIGVLPGSSNPAVAGLGSEQRNAACLVGTVRERKTAKMDEWMYELQEGESHAAKSTGDPKLDTIVAMSYSLEKLHAGEPAKAGLALECVSDVDMSLVARVAHVRRLIALSAQNVPLPLVGDGLQK